MGNENADFGGPSIDIPIPLTFILMSVGAPRTPQDYFWTSPKRSHGRPGVTMDARGFSERLLGAH